MPGKLIFVTYASGSFVRNFRANGWFARYAMGADEVLFFTRADLERDPAYAQHREIFDAERGAGYWAWKPLFILQALSRAGPDDVVIYQDCGAGFRYKSVLRPRRLIALARRHGFIAGVRIPHHGPNRRWNRRQCLAIMGVDNEAARNAPQIEATLSLWTGTAQSREFVGEWLNYCLDHEAIRAARPDELAGEDPEFIEHRYDQAVLTNLCLKRAAPVLDVAPQTLPFAKSLTMLELDLRAAEGGLARLVHLAITRFGALRRRLRAAG